MRLSHPITDDGRLIAVAALADMSWFLLAIDARLEELDRVGFPTAEEVERAAHGHLRRRHAIAGSASHGA